MLQDYTKKDFQGLAHSMCDTRLQRDKLRDALEIVLSNKNIELGWDPEVPSVLLGILCSDVRLVCTKDYQILLSRDHVAKTHGSDMRSVCL